MTLSGADPPLVVAARSPDRLGSASTERRTSARVSAYGGIARRSPCRRAWPSRPRRSRSDGYRGCAFLVVTPRGQDWLELRLWGKADQVCPRKRATVPDVSVGTGVVLRVNGLRGWFFAIWARRPPVSAGHQPHTVVILEKRGTGPEDRARDEGQWTLRLG